MRERQIEGGRERKRAAERGRNIAQLQAARQAWWARQSKARQGIERKELRCDRSKATQAVQPPENHQLSYSALRYEKSDVRSTPRSVVLFRYVLIDMQTCMLHIRIPQLAGKQESKQATTYNQHLLVMLASRQPDPTSFYLNTR